VKISETNSILLITNPSGIQYLLPRFAENQNEPLVKRAKWQWNAIWPYTMCPLRMYGKFAKWISPLFFHIHTHRCDATDQKRIIPEDGFSREPLDSAHARKCCHPWRLRRDDDG